MPVSQVRLSRVGMIHQTVPVITIDGPSGSGKGTVALRVSGELRWHLLDSGALYRALALYAVRRKSSAG